MSTTGDNAADSAPDLILASASPRRKALLRQIGIEPLCVPAQIDETPTDNEHPDAYCLRLARDKARTVRDKLPATVAPVLGSDTVVVLEGKILGQPADAAAACAMLRSLSGSKHQVKTAVTLWHAGQWQQALSTSDVWFRPLTDAEIETYVATGEPMDKAGAYAIQGRAAAFIPRIEGSFSGIMGLPLFETVQLLQNAGVYPLSR
jgi:septum formation protein